MCFIPVSGFDYALAMIKVIFSSLNTFTFFPVLHAEGPQ